MDSATHPFEAAGLGKAPFRFVGMEAQDLRYGSAILNRAEYEQTGIAVETKPGGSCAYCGTYIVDMYNVRSSDGRTFHVGSDCIGKTGDRELVGQAKQASRKRAAARRAAKAQADNAALVALLADPEARALLSAAPHPSPVAWRAPEENTLLAYIEWMGCRAGAKGRGKALALAKLCVSAAR